jgi:hypothetical protein
MNSTRRLVDSVLYGTGTQETIALDIDLHVGDTLDFAVGVGPSKSHGSDSTGLNATIIRTES